MFDELVQDAKIDKSWGNRFHIQAMSTFLNKDIVIYNKFPESMIQSGKNIFELYREFNIDKNIFGRHIKYCPMKSDIFNYEETRTKTLFGFFDQEMKHFSSLIPSRLNNLEFKPDFKWFSLVI